ncbi:hypothetical protein NC652_027074 [Populus alba x Populus x berolinensis]|nr:hypothetical protein NC652_027074 [Populus alba x Populus x berolinensis]
MSRNISETGWRASRFRVMCCSSTSCPATRAERC